MRSLLVISFLAFCFVGNGQIIDFPDANFKNALVNTNCVDLDGNGTGDVDADLNGDGEIEVSEALEVVILDVSNKQISSLDGIELFRNLQILNCSSNNLTFLNVQELTNLLILYCSGNQITALKVEGLTRLNNLNCSDNQISFLDIQSLERLAQLVCSNNQLTSLNVQGLTNLNYFSCRNNQLTSLNVQGLTKLSLLSCSLNQLTSLNLEGLLNLSYLACSENRLTSLNLQELARLTDLYCNGNELISLDIKNLTQLKKLNCNSNKLTSLDAQGLMNLTDLQCFENYLITLNVQGLANLTTLDCAENHLTSLNLQGLAQLKYINCEFNQITSLDVQGLINLGYFVCRNNQLLSLNVLGLTNLTDLYCNGNQLTSLNIQDLTKLNTLDCGFNQLKSLDAQGLMNLKQLSCSNNQLTSLNIQGLTNLTDLSCGNNQLKSIDTEGLINLNDLNCFNNQLDSLDVKGLTNLKYFFCGKNQITTLNVQGLTNMEELNCDANQLTSLDVKGLTNLAYLYCDTNQLASLNVKGLKNLKVLSCDKNKLSNLDVQGLTGLIYLWCNENELTNLDVLGLKNLEGLSCDKNKLTSLDVLGLTKLVILYCERNQLTSLLLKGTQLKDDIRFENNPNLQYICCNEDLIPTIQDSIISYGLTNCEVNSYCTFTPGDKFYVIKGENKYDDDNNGCDNLDFVFPSIKYLITDSISTATFISNSTGSYSIPIQAGTYTITPIIDNPENFVVSPTFLTTTFPNSSDTINQDFCITPKGFLNKINITIIPLFPPARPGFDASYKIIWENVGNQIESGTLNFTYEETLLDYISATQTEDLKSDGIVSWYFNNLLPFEKREITVTLKVNRPTDTPAVNAGDKLYLTASILDNIFTLENTVVGSYDPNDKTCLQGDRVKPDMVGDYVDYLIRFENTGNFAAENIVVKDIIDTKTFDISTLKITDASHEVYTRIEGNKVEFIFENIQLPFDDANNDGYIAFKIKTLPSLVLGDSLKNLADIYFDYNFPIRTNEAQTTVAFPVFTKDITTEVNIYPNPVNDILYLDTNDHWTKAEIFDIAGRIMRSVNLNNSSMDVSELNSGTYFIRLKDGEKVRLVKFVKI